MALSKWQHTALYADVNGFVHGPLTSVSTTVKLAGTQTLATLFSDPAGAIPLLNPFLNDPILGQIIFYVQSGTYDVTPLRAGFTLPTFLNENVGGTNVLSASLAVTPTSGQATIVATNLIPANARVTGVFVLNNLGLGVSLGLSGYHVGDGTIIDRWSGHHAGGIPITLNYQSVQGDFGSADEVVYAAATNVVLSALGGNFDGTGQVTVTVKYRIDGP